MVTADVNYEGDYFVRWSNDIVESLECRAVATQQLLADVLSTTNHQLQVG